MDLTILRYFEAVYRTGSIRLAAADLHVAPSALSRQLLKLEDTLGTPLFERWARGVRPTDAGKVFASFVRNTLLDQDRMRTELEALRGSRRGHVRLLSTEGIVTDLIMPIITAFAREFPDVTFDLSLTGADRVTEGILRGAADVGVAFNAQPDAQLSFRHRIPDPVFAVMSPDHALAGRETLALEDLTHTPLALPALTFGIRRLIDGECKSGKINLTVGMTSNSIEALRIYARSGSGITFLPGLAIRSDLVAGKLVRIPMREVTFRRTAHDICVLAGRTLPPAIAMFVARLGEYAARGMAPEDHDITSERTT